MRFSQLFGKTLRETPSDVQLVSHQLMIRAAVMRSTGAGTFAYLPLGARALHRARQLVCSAMDGQEFVGQDDILPYEINSYRDLPKVLYENNSTSLRFFSFHTNNSAFESFDTSLQRIFKGCDLDLLRVESNVSRRLPKSETSDSIFVLPHSKGNYTFMRCDSCGYAATKDAAKFVIEDCGCDEEILKLEKVGTPNCNTITSLAEFLDIGKCQTLKAVMYVHQKPEGSCEAPRSEAERARPFGFESFVFVVVRGDLEVSERKILNVLGNGTLRLATEEEIIAVGAVPGYASPRGLNVASNFQHPTSNETIVIADSSIHTGRNFAAGANEHGYHFINVNYPRDFKATLIEDIASPIDGLRCGVCHNGYLRVVNGIKVASYYPRRAAESASTYLDADGRPKEIIMGSCEINLESLLVSIIEAHHDDHGIIFPESVAPYQVHLIKLGKADETRVAAEALYAKLPSVLYDDRDESAGVKFADADLIGLPIRITVSDKSLKAGGAEMKRRNSDVKEIVPLEQIKT